MKIAASAVQLTATHSYQEQRQQRESLTLWRDGGARVQLESASSSVRTSAGVAAVLTTQPATPPAPTQTATPATDTAADVAATDGSSAADDPNMAALIRFIEKLTGKRVRLFDGRALQGAHDKAQQAPAGESGRRGWGAIYERHESYRESEQTTLSVQALVNTSDGRQIAVTLDLNMNREFASNSDLSVRAGDALKDPLVINFNGTAAQLTATKFSFDIDSDGQNDQIAFVTPNSGFLALDRNGNGVIDNGSELFGAASGNGFAELAQYDQDGNHWIDENDAVWSQLKVWSKDGSGNDQLASLAERNIGALYLGAVATPFQLKDSANVTQGATRASGLYLEENGAAGTLQQVDLVV